MTDKNLKPLGNDNPPTTTINEKRKNTDLEIKNDMINELHDDEKFDYITNFDTFFKSNIRGIFGNKQLDFIFLLRILREHKSYYNNLKTAKSILDSGDSEIIHEIKLQLKELKFFKSKEYKSLSDNAENWLKLIAFFSKFLVECYEAKNSLRRQAQFWSKERRNVLPFMEKHLKKVYGNDVLIEMEFAGGRVDILLYNIPIELKLLKDSKYKENADKVLDDFFYKRLNFKQFNRYAGINGFEIILVVDIRKEVKSNDLDNYPLMKCAKIYYHNYCWYAVFLFQAFKGNPSNAGRKIT